MQIRPFDSRLELTNDGELSVFFIGAGSAFSKSFYQTNFILIKGKDHLLVDCGSLCPYVLATEYKTKITDIKNLLLTHPHADHIGGVEEMVLTDMYGAKFRPSIVITDYFKRLLWNQSLRGGIQYSEDGELGFDDYFVQIKPRRFAKRPVEIFEAEVGGINIKTFRTYHVTTRAGSLRKAQYSVGVIVDDRILFTGDSQFVPEQLASLQRLFNIEVIFHDCDTTCSSGGVHATYEQLKTLPAETRAKTFLCHYSTDSIDPVQDGFKGFVKRGVYYVL